MEKLEYRSIIFTEERHYDTPGYILPTPVVNYPGPETPYTRAIEYKHYLHRPSEHSVVVKETSSDRGEPYYPMPTQRNRDLYQKYATLAKELERTGKIVFVGRLANYKYFDMDQAIDNALELFYRSAEAKLFKGRHDVLRSLSRTMADADIQVERSIARDFRRPVPARASAVTNLMTNHLTNLTSFLQPQRRGRRAAAQGALRQSRRLRGSVPSESEVP